MKSIKLFVVYLVFNNVVSATLKLENVNTAFDDQFYKKALDPELCLEHLDYISKNVNLRLKFVDRGLRIPKSISEGNLVDLGNYHACINLKEENDDVNIDGKYCMVNIPILQDLHLPTLPELPHWPDWPLPWPNFTETDNEEYKMMQQTDKWLKTYRLLARGYPRDIKNGRDDNTVSQLSIKTAMCLPKSCTTREALDKLYFNLSSIGFEFEEDYCRLPNDKPWTPADTVSTVLLSLIGLVTTLSTSYDIHHTLFKKKDPKKANSYLQAFSVYTNTRRLLTFNKVPGAIECIDGIRAFAMAWVILGHTFTSLSSGAVISNILDVLNWRTSAKALWILTAPITVDTFFTLSGLLVVYTTAGKLTGVQLLKQIHLFYLNRLLRLFPILAFTIVLQISVFHRIADGPGWQAVEEQVNGCRVNWWMDFLYVQNYVNISNMCLPQTWYLAVDMQLHFISPLVLFWVLSGKKKQAWIALTAALIIFLTASTIFIFIQQLPTTFTTDREEVFRYFKLYYFNTLTRSPPFFVGMIYGYVLHLGRNQKVVLTKTLVTFFWAGATFLAGTVIYSTYYDMNNSGKNIIIDGLINAFARPAWAMAIGWMILACTHGYGGPINWVLSLKQLKLLSRLSYAMYIIHFPIEFVYAGAAVATVYFDVLSWVYIFLSHFVMTFLCAFIATVLIDSPATVYIKLLLGGGSKKTKEANLPQVNQPIEDNSHFEKSTRI